MERAEREKSVDEDDKALASKSEVLKSYASRYLAVWERVKPSSLLEKAFERHGRFVSRCPWLFMLLALALAAVMSLGLTKAHFETNVVRLWNPVDSDTGKNFRWLWKNHPPDIRRHRVFFRADNVLSPPSVREMFEVRRKIHSMVAGSGTTWSDACLKVPVIPGSLSSLIHPEEKSQDDEFIDDEFFLDDTAAEKPPKGKDPMLDYYPEPLCTFYNSLDRVCMEDSILELFGREGGVTEEQIYRLTSEEILEAVNNRNLSGMFPVEKDFRGMLGDVKLGQDGRIESAGVASFVLYGKMNVTESHLDKGLGGSVLGKQISLEVMDEATRDIEMAMESLFVELQLGYADEKQRNDSSFRLDFNVANSFQTAMNEQILGDIPKVFGSFGVMFAYVVFSLGGMNCVENRAWLALAGMTPVLLALLTSYGACSYMGFVISPLHNFIPFLLLGIGVDDMFVIVRAYDYYGSKVEGGGVAAKIAETMRYSGVAITITSLTDFLAFAIGGTTAIPALKSFCFYCGIGIICVYFYQSTWFVAWLTLDVKRRLAGRNALAPCLKSNAGGATSGLGCFQKCRRFPLLKRYGECLSNRAVQAFVILFSALLLSIGVYGNLLLDQEFDPWLFLSADAPAKRWKVLRDASFPKHGERVLLISEGSQPFDFAKIEWLTESLRNQTDIVAKVDSWYSDFKAYHEDNFEADGARPSLLSLPWPEARRELVQFMFSAKGARYRYFFKFEEDPLECGGDLPRVGTHIMQYDHVAITKSAQGIEAMNRVKDLVESAGFFPSRVFTFSALYAIWEIDEIIRSELYRNLGLATLAIYFATFVLMSDLRGSLFCLLSVALTLTNVSGTMHFWNLTIDTVTSTVLIICIGLSVDFSSHVVHTFMHTGGGDRSVRMRETLESVAPAVLHGGLSTLLAVVLMSLSDVYVFVAFFKIFVLVVFFGLYNGLVLLPVLLALLGPSFSGPTPKKNEEAHDGAELQQLAAVAQDKEEPKEAEHLSEKK